MTINTDKLFLSSDGDLCLPQEGYRVLRAHYSYTYQGIHNSLQLRATLRNGPYAWPGGYQMYLITNDGEAMCFDCARKEYHQLAYAWRHKLNDGWRIVGCDINYEDQDCYCCHCGKKIPASYGNDEPEED